MFRAVRHLSPAILAFAGLFTAAFAGESSQPSRSNACFFAYTPEVRDTLVVPALKKKFGDAYIYFDFDAPVVNIEKKDVAIQLSATRFPNGRSLLFEDLVFVVVDKCATHVIRAYATQQYQKVIK
jgi:hypothetical protein